MQGMTYIRGGGKLVVILGLLCALKIGIGSLFLVQRYSVAIDPLFSPALASAIKNFLTEVPPHALPSSETIFTQIKQQFPNIKSLSIEHMAPNILHYEVVALEPLLIINNDFVLTESGITLPRTGFASYRLRSLYTIAMQTPITAGMCISPILFTGIKRLSPQIFANYRITINDEFCIELHDKKQPFISILCSADRIPENALLIQCKHCINKKLAQKSLSHKRKKDEVEQLVADVRFNKQIIVYTGQGGKGYG